jgi:hypothetical protein
MAQHSFEPGFDCRYETHTRVFQRQAALDHQLRSPFARGDSDLPLPKSIRSASLVLESSESGE